MALEGLQEEKELLGKHGRRLLWGASFMGLAGWPENSINYMRARDAACANHVPASGAGFGGFCLAARGGVIGLLGLSVTINPSRQTRESCGGFSLGKRECEQARAQQYEAGCGQCKETVGDQIVIAHDTPATSDALPSSLKLSEQTSWERGDASLRFGADAT
jgi:hypothetical protein